MAKVLVATGSGIRSFARDGEADAELVGHPISAISQEFGSLGLAVVDHQHIWQRNYAGEWSIVADAGIPLQSIVGAGATIFAGAMNEAAVLRVSPSGEVERLASFDHVPGREQWLAIGLPLGVRGLTVTADGRVIFAAVHVGGIPFSIDRGDSWLPTIPVMFDVHEVRAHPSRPHLVAAACAVGLCVSQDHGQTWRTFSDGLEITNSLAVGVLEDEVLFSIQDGPFAKRSQIWRWKLGSDHLEQVRDGLPEWLDGKVDSNWITTGKDQAAILDGGGNLWLSQSGSRGWECIAKGLPYSSGLLLL
ncbi:hypothetical protein ACPOL_5917 [Acidisarcina polymorpha]|uniref:Uncharacterized protein n=1 Tax=Acidisarcina polymorpha TaxID=2211140 RepID=A0A2Z5G7Y3_9BACT|nr:hypothetical protein [Acidisarcina polymorpha]AXC15161.1 hypothetical protein ACPOL_5917 [Acidisarcina polymorpha]